MPALSEYSNDEEFMGMKIDVIMLCVAEYIAYGALGVCTCVYHSCSECWT